MAIPDFRLCDVCGAKVTTHSVFACTDRKCDAAGSMDDVGESFDLCPIHARDGLLILLRDSHDNGKKLCDWIEKVKAKK